MKTIKILILTLSIFFMERLSAQTNVSGNITVNTTWALSGSPFNLTGEVRVRGGVILTVQNGVQVNLQGYTLYIGHSGNSESGSLQASGVTFSNGGSNGRVQFETSSMGSIQNCNFTNCNINFNDNSSPTFSGNTLDANSSIYIRSQEVIPNISMTNVFNSQKIYLGEFSISSSRTLKNFTNCTYYFLTYNTVRVRGGATLTIENGSKIDLQNGTLYIGYYGYNESGSLQASGVTFSGSNGIIRFESNANGAFSNCEFTNQVKLEVNNQAVLTISNSNIGQLYVRLVTAHQL